VNPTDGAKPQFEAQLWRTMPMPDDATIDELRRLLFGHDHKGARANLTISNERKRRLCE
jgi:hypothetical protein